MRMINKRKALDAIEKCHKRCCRTDSNGDEWIHYETTLNELEALPPVQPQQMKGRWLPDNNFVYEMRFVCSVCKESEVVPTIGFTKYKPIWDFCPNCGADMRGEQDE